MMFGYGDGVSVGSGVSVGVGEVVVYGLLYRYPA